jgi:hypothetical protein
MNTDNPLCTGTHTEPTLPLPGLAYCGGCLNRLHHHLTDLAHHRAILPAFTRPGRRAPSGPKTGPSGKPAPPAPANLDVLAALDPRSKPEPGQWPIDATIRAWFTHWMQAMNARPPYNTDPLIQLTWMIESADWIATHPTVAEFHTAIRHTAAAARRLTADTPTPPVGSCPECAGRLHPRYGAVACRDCGTHWHHHQLHDLIGTVQPDRPIPIQTAWVANHLGIPERTLRYWAAKGHIRRHGRGYIDYGDVLRIIKGAAA